MVSMDRVTMKGGIRVYATARPFSVPMAVATASAIITAAAVFICLLSRGKS